jgi:hypothetical protein
LQTLLGWQWLGREQQNSKQEEKMSTHTSQIKPGRCKPGKTGIVEMQIIIHMGRKPDDMDQEGEYQQARGPTLKCLA